MNTGLVSGQPDKSLFSEPLTRFFRENTIPELLNKTSNAKNDRLLAIVSALIVENRLVSFKPTTYMIFPSLLFEPFR
jgi:hypothetical protein